jgi:hypothetical protein
MATTANASHQATTMALVTQLAMAATACQFGMPPPATMSGGAHCMGKHPPHCAQARNAMSIAHTHDQPLTGAIAPTHYTGNSSMPPPLQGDGPAAQATTRGIVHKCTMPHWRLMRTTNQRPRPQSRTARVASRGASYAPHSSLSAGQHHSVAQKRAMLDWHSHATRTS